MAPAGCPALADCFGSGRLAWLWQNGGVPPEKATRTILHVDMDAFYAAVEVLDRPELAGQPVIVGGTGRRGVVASCSYEARAYGVRSAMPSLRARQLCPHAVFVAGRFHRYAEMSQRIHAVFVDFTPLVEGISLDEAFLDVTGSERMFGPAPEIAAAIRTRIGREVGLSCSVGVAPAKFLAKLASEAAKPSASVRGAIPGPGIVVIPPGQELPFLHPLPIEALSGVGPATATRLHSLGVSTVGELAEVPPGVLERAVGRAHGRQLGQLARGVDDRRVEADRAIKSVSHEETYPLDLYDRAELRHEIVKMADSVASRLRRAGLAGRTVTLKVRAADFTTRTRSRSGPESLADAATIAARAVDLLAAEDVSAGVRLLGVGVSNLTGLEAGSASQMRLDLDGPADGGGEPERSWRDASRALDAIRDRFGEGSVGPATLLGPEGVRVKRPGDAQWGPSPDT
jgi:DNA polymerase-4